MERKKASDFPQELLNLFDLYVHGEIPRREFLAGAQKFAVGGVGRIELLLDVLNALNDTAEEGLATDNLFSPSFAVATVFMDPRRAMVGVRLNLGR